MQILANLRNTKSLSIWLICVAYIGLFFSTRVGNILLIPLLGYCLIISPREIIKSIREYSLSKILVGIFLLQVIGLLYTDNLKTGFFMLEKKICFLLIPLLVLPHLKKVDLDVKTLLGRLGFITILSSVVILGVAVYRKFILHDPQAFLFVSFRGYEGFTPIHYVYYSMYFACGSLFYLDSIFDSIVKKKYGWLAVTCLFLYCLVIIILVASKTGIIVFVLVSIIFLYYKVSNKRVFAFAALLVLISAFAFIFFNDVTRERFMGLNENLSYLSQDVLVGEFQATGLNMRLLFWKIQVVHIWRDGLMLTGVGTGDAQDYINSLYNLRQYELYGYIDWDSHNQWVYAMVQLGVLGLLALGFLFAKSFKEALVKTDFKLLCFLLITLGFSLSECILEVNKGIVFFTLFLTILTIPYTRNDQPQLG